MQERLERRLCQETASIAVAIPTFGRDQVLVDAVAHLLRQSAPPTEILVLDQSPNHTPSAQSALSAWNEEGAIRWLHLPHPSIPAAMNEALLRSRADVVLFLDDDVVPDDGFISSHWAAHKKTGAAMVAGRVIQPWQENLDFSEDEQFHFAVPKPCWIDCFMGGNFSIRRAVALRVGGFDENFVHVAYNFEVEFAHRLRSNGYQIYFEPRACLHHLKAPSGGTRSIADHLRTWSPSHSVGAYYCTMRTTTGWHRTGRVLHRFLSAAATRHHLRQPWWIPAASIAEIRGLMWALALAYKGPVYLGVKRAARG
jgi:GT2 family glycosyltransferase